MRHILQHFLRGRVVARDDDRTIVIQVLGAHMFETVTGRHGLLGLFVWIRVAFLELSYSIHSHTQAHYLQNEACVGGRPAAGSLVHGSTVLVRKKKTFELPRPRTR